MKKSSFVSVIIPTKNEERNIGRCLKSIIDNGYQNYEIIVVDQSSTDRTVEISKKLGAKVVLVKDEGFYKPPSQSRNEGFTHSRGEYIYHLDADMELEKGLLSEIVDVFKDKTISAIIIPENDVPKNYWGEVKAFERSMYRSSGVEMEAARVTRRDIFENNKYDKDIISGEDWNIHEKYNLYGKTINSKHVVNHYLDKTSIKKEFLKKFKYGKASGGYVAKKKSYLILLFIKLFWLYFVNIVINVFINPKVVFGFIVLRFIDFIALLVGLLHEAMITTVRSRMTCLALLPKAARRELSSLAEGETVRNGTVKRSSRV